MKKGIHPDFQMCTYTDINSGKTFKIASTSSKIIVEISSASHPFYTGKEKIIDSENRIDVFTRKQKAASKLSKKVNKKKKKEEKRKKSKVKKLKGKKKLTLRDMLKQVQE